MSAIKVELELVDGSFTNRMLHAGETIAQFNRNVARSSPELRRLAAAGQSVIKSMEQVNERSQGFLGTLRDIAVVTTAVSMGFNKLVNIQDTWIGKVVRTNAEFERLVFQMRAMSGAADPIAEAAKEVDSLVDAAKNAPFSLQALSNGFTKLKATGTDPLAGSLQALQDGVSAFGGTDAVFERTILGISQMSGKGVIQMEELRQQVGESMPQAVALMAASMGISMATLIDKISTGRLAAKPALDLFYAELDRAFGGTAQRMMQTFSGQVARTQTQMQEFARIIGGVDEATGIAGEGGFMATLTAQVRDLNDALDSAGGRNFARMIGDGLNTTVVWLRSAVEAAYEWRQAIGNTAELLAFVAGLKLVGAGLGTLRGLYASATTSIEMLRFGFVRANAAAALHQAALRNTAISIASVDRAARLAAATNLRAMVTMMGRVAPVAGILGLAIYEVADAFDVFGNRGKEAIKTLREFGELSAAEIDKAADNIAKRQADLAKEIAEIEYSAGKSIIFGRQEDRAAKVAEIIAQKKEEADIEGRLAELEADRVKLEEARRKNAESEAQRAADRRMRSFDQQLQGQQRLYRDTRDRINKEADLEVSKAAETGRKVSQIEAERTELLKQNAAEYYKWQLNELGKQLDVVRGAGKDTVMSQTDLMIADRLAEKIDEIKTAQDSLSSFGVIPDIGDGDNTEKSYEKLSKLVDGARDDVASLEDQLNGANSELADFQAKFARGAYGDTSLQQTRELGAEMESLLRKKQALDDINEGAKDIRQDIEQTRIKLLEKRMELEERARDRELTEGEKIALRIREGYYKGFGKDNPAQKAIDGMIEGLALQGKVATRVGDVMQNNTFGNPTANKIETINDKLRDMLGIVTGIGNGVAGISWDGLQNGLSGDFGSLMGGSAPRITNWSGSILELIAKGESGGDYNATLDNGAWTGGPKNLVGMTLNEVRALQKQMLANPANRAKYGNGLGSSALGKYQIVGKTLEGLMGEMGLSGNELFDEGMQDRMASHLLNRRLASGQGMTGLRNEWTSLKNVSDAAIQQALAASANGPTRDRAAGYVDPMVSAPNAMPAMSMLPSVVPSFSAEDQAEINGYMERRNQLQDEFLRQAADLAAEETSLDEATRAQDTADYMDQLRTKITTATESLDGLDKNYRATVQLIEKGDIGVGKDASLPANKELLEIAKQLDAVEKQRADRKEAAGNIDNANLRFKEQELQMERKIAELEKQTANPNARLDSSGLVELRSQLDQYLADVVTVYGKESTEYAAATERKRQILAQFTQQELWQDASASAAKTQELNRSLMGERQARQAAMQQELAEVDAKIAYYKQAGLLDVQATEQFEREKAAIRAKYAQQDPIGNKLKEWGDLQGNLDKAAAGWMDSLADGLAGLITGTGDLRSVLQGIANDMIKMVLKYAMSSFMGNKGKAATPGAGKGAKGGKSGNAMGKMGKAVGIPTGHTGGIAGALTARSMVNPAIFKNARKFHSGANSFGGRRLMPGEMPAIVKKDEGIFTPEQMAALGSAASSNNQSVVINSPVTVNANGGTPEQNADLAEQVRKQMEGTMRGVVVDELRKQQRPGNMLSGR